MVIVDRKQLPPELLASSRWVTYKIEEHEGRKACKIPYAARTGKRADSTDPDDWCSFVEAQAASEKYAGVGLMIGAPFVAVDLDKCRNPESGVVDQWAQDFFQQHPPTFTELSPSKRGFHCWYRGVMPKGARKGYRAADFEVYFGDRYFTVTGLHVEGTPLETTELNADQIRQLLAAVEARRPGKAEPKATTKPQSAKLQLLMAGDFEAAGFADVSAAVQSLLTLLAVEHLLDRDKIEADFKASGLYRDFRPARPSNWIEKWERLRNDELDKAISQAREVLAKIRTRQSQKAKAPAKIKGKFIGLETVKATELVWLWPKRIPRGNVTMFAGDPGIGKSLLALDLVGRGSIGADFLDGQKNGEVFKSLLLMAEDDRETIIVPRLKVLGADLTKISAIDMVELFDEDDNLINDRMISLEHDLKTIADRISADPEIKLIVIDPISNYMGSKSMFKDQEFRAVMMPMVKLAQETGVSIITIMHNSKQTGRTALQKVGISLGGAGAARIGWTFMNKDDEIRQMIIMKKNLGNFPGIEFTTESAILEIEGRPTDQAQMKFLGDCKVSADAAIAENEDSEAKRESRVGAFLKKFIPIGVEIKGDDLFKAAKDAGISDRTLRRAVSEQGIKIKGSKKFGLFYYWPDASTVEDDAPPTGQGEIF